LPVPEACDFIRQAAQGLQHAHEKGLIHRDIKPSNLLLDKSGVVKISDLGLVLVDDPTGPAESRITREGLTVGTPDFLAPEQARNPRGADIRADIYALGCTFYYLLTAEVPYPQGTVTEKMLQHAREPMPIPARAT
jgi:serine/threonine protein kinase